MQQKRCQGSAGKFLVFGCLGPEDKLQAALRRNKGSSMLGRRPKTLEGCATPGTQAKHTKNSCLSSTQMQCGSGHFQHSALSVHMRKAYLQIQHDCFQREMHLNQPGIFETHCRIVSVPSPAAIAAMLCCPASGWSHEHTLVPIIV